MSLKRDATLADPQRVIADLRHRLADAEQRAAERTAERDEAEAQKAAMAEVLGVINSSPGELAPVFEAMLEKALRLAKRPSAPSPFDGIGFRAAARLGYDPGSDRSYRTIPAPGMGR